jgi:hypothetical protein
MRGRRVAPAISLAAIAATALAGAAHTAARGSATPPQGDRKAIAFYGHQADAFSNLDGVRIVERGFFFVHADGGTRVTYSWGAKPPAGFRPATATVDAQVLEGKIGAYLAVLRATKVRRLRILMAGGEVYTSTTRCWRKSDASGSPFGTGERFVFNDGNATFAPLVRSGSATTVALAYEWSPGATATETDVFASTHPAPVRITIAIRGARSLTVHKTITPLAQAPALPVAPVPNVPRPKPLCH